MYKRILVPLDGSKLAEGILPVVKRFAEALGAEIHLLTIVDQELVGAVNKSLGGRYQQQPKGSLTELAESYLQTLATGLQVPLDQVRFSAHIGVVPEAIIAEAEQQPDTLIAMSTHGRSGVGRFLLGSVANKVLHGTETPLLLYRSQDGATRTATSEVSTVIVPLDGSALAEQALPHVADLAKALDLQVLLVRMTQPLTSYDVGQEGGYYPADLLEQLEQDARDYLKSQAEALQKLGLKKVSVREIFGYPANAVIDLAQKTPRSFVAMTTHGRSGLRRFALGSVAERVVTYGDAPVLVIRPKAEAAKRRSRAKA